MINRVEMESVPCPLGCKKDDELILTGKDILYNIPGEFNVVRCRKCGLMRTNPRPTQNTIGFYYPDYYGPYQYTKVKDKVLRSTNYPSWVQFIRNKMFKFNTDRLPSIEPGRMLEIGCASGSFMDKMAGEGWNVEGIEFSPQAAEDARSLGYPVYSGCMEKAPDPEKHYDLVVGWMVLEHLHDPILSLKKLYSWTNSGGWLVLSVPNAGSLEFTLFRDKWYALQVPNHLSHYTPKTIELVLARGGWHVEKVFHQRILSNLIASIGYILQDYGVVNKLAHTLMNFPENAGRKNYLLYPLALLLSTFGQTGRMTIWARRTDRD